MTLPTIGIIGDGQLALMLIAAGKNYDITFNVLPQSKKIPQESICFGMANIVETYEELYQLSDIVTYEFENLPVTQLVKQDYIQSKPTIPSLDCLLTIQDKSKQKQLYIDNGLNVSKTILKGTGDKIYEYLEESYFGRPYADLIIKRCVGGYDGRGLFYISNREVCTDLAIPPYDVKTKIREFLIGDVEYMLEERIYIKLEVSVIVAINDDSYHIFNPTNLIMNFKTKMLDSLTIDMNQLEDSTIQEIKDTGLKVAKLYNTTGLFAIEMFIDHRDTIWINEVSPRPHNSGHHTIDTCQMSQYDALIRILTKQPFIKNVEKRCIMKNITGADFKGHYRIDQGCMDDLTGNGFKVYMYNKLENFPGRKMGHMTYVINETDTRDIKDIFGSIWCIDTSLLFKPALVSIVMGSVSDLETVQPAIDILIEFNIGYHVQVLSVHRMPQQMYQFANHVDESCSKVVIACAGKAASLPSMIASMTTLPVIGLPAKSDALHGIDSLYSMVQMPKGVPVATVAIGNGVNAALLAIRILSIEDTILKTKLKKYHEEMNKNAVESNQLLMFSMNLLR